MAAKDPAQAFIARYERFWRDGAADICAVYLADAILCGFEIVKGQDAIGKLLGAIWRQGWTDISIEMIECAAVGEAIVLACRYTARSETDEMTAKSSYALIKEDGLWKAAMHTAT